MGSPPHILIIDDHAMFRTGLAMVIRSALPQASVFEVGWFDQAMGLDADTMNVVLLDIELIGLSGLECIAPLKRRWPGVKVLTVSAHSDTHNIREALARGADQFIAKSESATRIVEAIEDALAGRLGAPESLRPATSQRSLTPRQCEVIDLMHKGLPNKSIAQRLGLSENTVRRHVQDILTFFEVGNRAEAVFVARQRGLVY